MYKFYSLDSIDSSSYGDDTSSYEDDTSSYVDDTSSDSNDMSPRCSEEEYVGEGSYVKVTQEDLTVTEQFKWTLKQKTNVFGGYEETLCLRCKTGLTQALEKTDLTTVHETALTFTQK